MLPTKFRFIRLSGFIGEYFVFRNQPMRNKNCLWQPCLSTDRDEMSNPYRGSSIDAPAKLWFIWLGGFRGIFLVEINQSETRIACGGHVCERIKTK
jgi:hypothetical protein